VNKNRQLIDDFCVNFVNGITFFATFAVHLAYADFSNSKKKPL